MFTLLATPVMIGDGPPPSWGTFSSLKFGVTGASRIKVVPLYRLDGPLTPTLLVPVI